MTPSTKGPTTGDVAEALTQAFEYFDNLSDDNHGDYGNPSPNKEMRLAQLCKDALDQLESSPAAPPPEVQRVVAAAEKLNYDSVVRAAVNALPGVLYRDIMDPLPRALDEAFQAYYESSPPAPSGEVERAIVERLERIERLALQLQKMEIAARAFVAKIDVVHEHPAYESVWAINQLHVGPYTGPTYTDELANLRAALSLPAQGETK